MKTFAKKSVKSLGTILGASALAVGLGGTSPQAQAQLEPLLGQISMFAGNFNPRGWQLCQGQLLPISSNTALFSIFGTTYGGDGRTTFGLPDLKGRVPVGTGLGAGSDYRLGQKGGAERVALSVNEMPSHSHTASVSAALRAYNGAGNNQSPNGAALAVKSRTKIYSDEAPDVNMASGAIAASATVAPAGGGQSHENRMPFLVINYIIATQGIYPSRS